MRNIITRGMIVIIVTIILISCTAGKQMHWPARESSVTGNEFYHQAFAMKWAARDSLALKLVLAGDVPGFLGKFSAVHVEMTDSVSGKKHEITYYVSPDYLSIGTNDDWA